MSTTVFEAVKGKELLGLIERFAPSDLKELNPEKYFNVTISIEETKDSDEDMPMPPEERISQRLIDAVKRSEESYKRGEGTLCNTIEETEALFNKIWNE